MNLQIKNNQKGFTIVELLIVIVVIAILAAITIVAYNGIQNRAKTSSAQSMGNTVIKKAEAYNAILSSYPATVADFDAASSPAEAKLAGEASKVTGAAPTDEKTVHYVACPATGAKTGAKVGYRDATTGTVIYMNAGTATGTTATC